MQANVRERIAATQRDRFARMRENAEQLSALKSAHRRMMELWGMCEAIVRAAAWGRGGPSGPSQHGIPEDRRAGHRK